MIPARVFSKESTKDTTVIRAEKDPRQRRYNRQILADLFAPALLLSDHIVVKARKLGAGENRLGA